MNFIRSTSRTNGHLTADDIQEIIVEAKQEIKRLEAAGNTRRADKRRVKTAIGLASTTQKNSESRIGKVLAQKLNAWVISELSQVDFDALNFRTSGDPMASGSTATELESEDNADSGAVEAASEVIARARQPERSFAELKGDELLASLEGVVEQIELGLYLGDHPAYDNQTIGNFLFTGEPGTGKTTGAEAVANALVERDNDFTFLPLKGTHIKSHLYGQSQTVLEGTLEWANENGPTLLFIDELDEIASREQHEETKAMTSSLLAALDGGSAFENIVLVGATNRIDDIDPAMQSRFGQGIVEFTEPANTVKPEIIMDNLIGNGVEVTVNEGQLHAADINFDGLTGRDLVNAAKLAIRTAYDGQFPIVIEQPHIEQAVQELRDKNSAATN